MLATLLIPTAAWAQALSADIELVRPTLSPDSPHGIDGMAFDGRGTLRVGALVQFTKNPLVLTLEGEPEDVDVVANRLTTHAAFSYDATERVGLRAAVPVASQWGTESTRFGNDGTGLGDLTGGIRFAWIRYRGFSAGNSFDLALPSGTGEAWLGDAGPRLHAALSLSQRAGPVTLATDVGATIRSSQDSTADWRNMPQLAGGLGARCRLPLDLGIHAAFLGRFGVDPFLDGGSAAGEAVGGLFFEPGKGAVRFDLGFGHGLSNGVGATDLRVLSGIVLRRSPAAEDVIIPVAPPPVVEVMPEQEIVEPPLPVVTITKKPDEVWKEDELARIQESRIEIRDPLQFKVDTDIILPVSLPTLRQVAQLLNDTPAIVHLVIVGHASEEGTYEYNYELSLSRAVAVFEELVRAGVHPDRLSVRSMGEVQSVVQGSDEASLAVNRRVEFRIARVLFRGEEPVTYSEVSQLPWNGEQRPTTTRKVEILHRDTPEPATPGPDAPAGDAPPGDAPAGDAPAGDTPTPEPPPRDPPPPPEGQRP